jgi:hypothetical protein
MLPYGLTSFQDLEKTPEVKAMIDAAAVESLVDAWLDQMGALAVSDKTRGLHGVLFGERMIIVVGREKASVVRFLLPACGAPYAAIATHACSIGHIIAHHRVRHCFPQGGATPGHDKTAPARRESEPDSLDR